MTDDQAKRRELRKKIIFLVQAVYEYGVFRADEEAYEAMDESLQGQWLETGQVTRELMQLFDTYLAAEREKWIAEMLDTVDRSTDFIEWNGTGVIFRNELIAELQRKDKDV